MHDSQVLAKVIDETNSGTEVCADSTYRIQEAKGWLKASSFHGQIHYKGSRHKPLSAFRKPGFDHKKNSQGGKWVRTIGLTRAKLKVELMNLAYSMQRHVHLCA